MSDQTLDPERLAPREGAAFDDGLEATATIVLPDAPHIAAPSDIPAGHDEGTVLRRAVAGDPFAADVLLDLYMPTVYGFVLPRVGGNVHAAEDILQETLEEAMRSAHTFRGESSLATWLCAIARRRLARHYERERRSERAGRLIALPPDPVDGHIDRRLEVMWALGTLPATQRQALVLKYLDDLPVAQVASEMGKSVVQVQNLLQHGRDGLKRALARTGD